MNAKRQRDNDYICKVYRLDKGPYMIDYDNDCMYKVGENGRKLVAEGWFDIYRILFEYNKKINSGNMY